MRALHVGNADQYAKPRTLKKILNFL